MSPSAPAMQPVCPHPTWEKDTKLLPPSRVRAAPRGRCRVYMGRRARGQEAGRGVRGVCPVFTGVLQLC